MDDLGVALFSETFIYTCIFSPGPFSVGNTVFHSGVHILAIAMLVYKGVSSFVGCPSFSALSESRAS